MRSMLVCNSNLDLTCILLTSFALGLFTPNAGQHFRDEQRRRRSQYDRGTRLAALEEYDYDAHIHQQGHYLPQ